MADGAHHPTDEVAHLCLQEACDIFRCFVLSEQQQKTQRYSNYSHIQQRTAERHHIWMSLLLL